MGTDETISPCDENIFAGKRHAGVTGVAGVTECEGAEGEKEGTEQIKFTTEARRTQRLEIGSCKPVDP
jgi:hypothetical protein